MIDYVCANCRETKQHKKGAARKYCSITCVAAASSRQVELPCLACNTPFMAMKWRVEAGRSKYCSAECYRDRLAAWFECAGCTVTFRKPPRDLRKSNVSHCSIECKRRDGWGTKTSLNQKLRNSKEAKEWRKSVFTRDDYTCQLCGVRGAALHADHIKSWALYPKLRFELSNGRALCVPCHRMTPNYGRKIVKPTQPLLFD